MNRLLRFWALAFVALLAVSPAFAQGTTGAIEGKVADEQGLALAGVTATARNASTGFVRSAVSDSTGIFRLPGLLVGTYELKIELNGFATQTRQVIVNVGATTEPDVKLTVASKTEELTIVAEAPLIDTNNSGVGEIITSAQIENLPLNGRQFGNLAALAPGVSLGFHTDPTKATQFAPQVNGGGGRNINYLIDGGDNNDDTVGGLTQAFPLDSIGEFNFETQRFRADTGRSNGGTIQVVTKSGTNELKGSAFEFFRDKSLNSKTHSEELAGADKGDYRRNEFGGSLGGPIVKDQTHFFLSYERLSQNTTQVVDTQGLFPDKDGVFPLPFTQNLFVGKITHQLNAQNYLSLRYGFNNDSSVYGASPLATPESWGTVSNKYHSLNFNVNSSLSGGRLNEFVFQFTYFKNNIAEDSNLPSELFPNGVFVGQNPNTPQTTEQHKFQFRDDFTWVKGRHEFKVGASMIYEPTLDITFSTGQQPLFNALEDDRNSPISNIGFNGAIGDSPGTLTKLPNKQYAAYIQDTWRVNNKLMLDLGVRYDLIDGFAIDQSQNSIFAELTNAANAGTLSGSGFPCPCIGLQDFGKSSAEDKNNIAPRLGFTYDINENGKTVVRGGYGRYYDFPYTNANVLFAAVGAQSSFGAIYQVNDTNGIRNPDGSLFNVGDPLPPNQLPAATAPLPSQAASPRIKQPYTDQVNFGLSRDLGHGFAMDLTGVYSSAHDLGTRPNLNLRIDGGARRFAGILPLNGTNNFRVDTSDGIAHYKGVTIGIKKRWDGKLQLNAWYTLSQAKSSASQVATDEFITYTVLDQFNPFQDRQEAVTQSDATHRFTASGSWAPGMGFTFSPIFRYHSASPYNVITGHDDNGDGTINNDLPVGVLTYNSARGADFKQLDLRISKRFGLGGSVKMELIAEIFNLTNAENPGVFSFNQASSNFGQPTQFAGDFQRGEQRLAQFGARLEF
jgi:hypothetical protein